MSMKDQVTAEQRLSFPNKVNLFIGLSLMIGIVALIFINIPYIFGE